jgi:2-methylisocitrate lyase-like PEP mutase family enzyme
MSGAGSRLRALIAEGGALAAPGVHDPYSARIAVNAGHRALYLGGNAMALGLGKGQPFLTSTETRDITARIAASVEAPLVVDAGAGFGGGAHLHVVLREIEAAGAAALHIDDQPYPKPVGYHFGKGALVAPEEMAARLRLAVAARRDADLLLIARTDALRVTGSVEETIARCRAYVEAGAEALMVLDLGPDRAAAFRAALPGVPLVWIGGVAAPVPTLGELSRAGFALACYPFNGVAAIATALGDLWAGLARDGTIGQAEDLLARARRETVALAGLEPLHRIEQEGYRR